jgi:DNA-binding NtrC family response regulator
MVRAGTFRADLFYRLSIIPIKVPPLREIREDIPLLVQNFLSKLALNCHVSAEAMEVLQRYHWPGNVRELRNALERAAVLCRGEEIRPEDLHLCEDPIPTKTLKAKASTPTSNLASIEQLREMERKMILETLARNQNNKSETARELGISISTLKRKLKAYQGENSTQT